MAEIHDINERKPHLQGEATCLACGHKWHAVALVGTTELECPECGTERGVFSGFVKPETFWTCQCGCCLFYLEPEQGSICSQCGVTQWGY